MTISNDATTIRALRGDVALQISRFLQRQKLNQAAAAKRLSIPQRTVSKIVNGQVSGLSLELLLRIAVRAGLPLVLQTGAAPEEAGAFLSGMAPAPRSKQSRLADDARTALLETAREMTPEQRLRAHCKLSEVATSLYCAGKRSG